MTDVWKSNAKKFCEICKVWFGDNRASIEHHERGQKHKNALAAKLRELGKKSTEDAKKAATLNAQLVAMEMGAMASMKQHGEHLEEGPAPMPTTASGSKYFDPRNMKDINVMAKAMAARRSGIGVSGGPPTKVAKTEPPRVKPPPVNDTPVPIPDSWKKKKRKRFIPGQPPQDQSQPQNEEEEEEEEEEVPHTIEPIAENKEWVQTKTDDGNYYYWHIFTGETTWEQPESFFTQIEYDVYIATLDAQEQGAYSLELNAPVPEQKFEVELNQGNYGQVEHFSAKTKTEPLEPEPELQPLLPVEEPIKTETPELNDGPSECMASLVPDAIPLPAAPPPVKRERVSRWDKKESEPAKERLIPKPTLIGKSATIVADFYAQCLLKDESEEEKLLKARTSAYQPAAFVKPDVPKVPPPPYPVFEAGQASVVHHATSVNNPTEPPPPPPEPELPQVAQYKTEATPEETTTGAGLLGGWTRVVKSATEEPKVISPWTIKAMEEEEKKRQEDEELAKREAQQEVLLEKVEFSEKTATVSKKVKGPIEFKKRTGTKNVRKRTEE